MSDRLHLVSHFPGRLRVRAQTFRLIPEVAGDVAQRLREEPGVRQVDIAPRTGSLVISYQPEQIQLPRVVNLLIVFGGLHGIEVDARAHENVPAPGTRVRDVLGQWDAFVSKSLGGKLDLRTAIPGALAAAGLGVFFFGRRRTPEWYDLLFWSFVTFVNVNKSPSESKDPLRGREARAG